MRPVGKLVRWFFMPDSSSYSSERLTGETAKKREVWGYKKKRKRRGKQEERARQRYGKGDRRHATPGQPQDGA